MSIECAGHWARPKLNQMQQSSVSSRLHLAIITTSTVLLQLLLPYLLCCFYDSYFPYQKVFQEFVATLLVSAS
jgi:hypothetical protein